MCSPFWPPHVVIVHSSLCTDDTIATDVQAAMCCAIHRADLVPELFSAVLKGQDALSETETTELFQTVQETINFIWPFVGVPQVIPACLDLAGYIRSKGLVRLETNRLRSVSRVLYWNFYFLDFGVYHALNPIELTNISTPNRSDLGPEDVQLGSETRKAIYKASANSEVFEMLSNYYGDFAYALDTVGFG